MLALFVEQKKNGESRFHLCSVNRLVFQFQLCCFFSCLFFTIGIPIDLCRNKFSWLNAQTNIVPHIFPFSFIFFDLLFFCFWFYLCAFSDARALQIKRAGRETSIESDLGKETGKNVENGVARLYSFRCTETFFSFAVYAVWFLGAFFRRFVLNWICFLLCDYFFFRCFHWCRLSIVFAGKIRCALTVFECLYRAHLYR